MAICSSCAFVCNFFVSFVLKGLCGQGSLGLICGCTGHFSCELPFSEWTMKRGRIFLQGVRATTRHNTCFFFACLPIWLLCYQNKMRGSVNFYHFLKWCSFPWCSEHCVIFPLWLRGGGVVKGGSSWEHNNRTAGRRALGPVTDAGTKRCPVG